jgi:hypothetical protein
MIVSNVWHSVRLYIVTLKDDSLFSLGAFHRVHISVS